MNTIILLSHLGLGDNIFNIPLVNYLSLTNKVEFVCKIQHSKNIKYFIKDNKNISLFMVESDKDISPKYNCPNDKYNKLTENKIVMASGSHITNSNISSFPFFMYDDVKIDRKIFKDYGNYINTQKSLDLYDIIKDYQYIFISNETSQGKVFDIDTFLQKKSININETLIVCPNKNIYNLNHPFYKIAENFIYKTNDIMILDYKLVIENAEMNILSDSSLFCFAVQLKLKSKNNILFTRNSWDWNRLFDFFENSFTIFK